MTTEPSADFDAASFLDFAYAKYRENRGGRQRQKHLGKERGYAHAVYQAAEGEWATVIYEITRVPASEWSADPRAMTDFEKADHMRNLRGDQEAAR
jgi:hypothetical protein